MEAALALEAKQAEGIRIFEVRGISSVTDYMVVATGTSAPHLKALVNETRRRMKEMKVACHRVSGDPESGWVVADCIHAVVHVFSTEARAYYVIEELWSKAKEIPLPQP